MLIMEVSRLAVFFVCMLLYYYRGGYVDHGGEQAGYLQRLYVALGEVAIQLVQVNQHQAQLKVKLFLSCGHLGKKFALKETV